LIFSFNVISLNLNSNALKDIRNAKFIAYNTRYGDNIDKYIEFDGDISYRYSGYLAIDDIEVLVGQCPPQNYCDFEDGLCGNYQGKVGNYYNF
jgi:hypothetical protein